MRKIFALVLIFLILGGLAALYVCYKPHRDPTSEKAEMTISAVELQMAFVENQEQATEKFIDQVVSVKGEMSEKGSDYLILNDKVYARMAEGDFVVPSDGKLTVKGRVVSYDDLFEQVRIDFATLD